MGERRSQIWVKSSGSLKVHVSFTRMSMQAEQLLEPRQRVLEIATERQVESLEMHEGEEADSREDRGHLRVAPLLDIHCEGPNMLDKTRRALQRLQKKRPRNTA